MARRIGRKTRGRRRGSKRRSMRNRRSMRKRGGDMGLENTIREHKSKLMEISNFFGEDVITNDMEEAAKEEFPEDVWLVDYFIAHRGEIVDKISANMYENRN